MAQPTDKEIERAVQVLTNMLVESGADMMRMKGRSKDGTDSQFSILITTSTEVCSMIDLIYDEGEGEVRGHSQLDDVSLNLPVNKPKVDDKRPKTTGWAPDLEDES